MKILIIGDDPQVTGGVCNYTRPLYLEFEKSDEEILYLYSASRLKADYRLLVKTQIVEDNNWKNNNVYKIINSQNLDKNYDHLELDSVSEKNDTVFKAFIEQHKPDVMHINEIIGFSSNIINIAKEYNIKVLVTVHEYWWLCPKRVMVDFNRNICEGPNDLDKCTHCVADVSKNYNSSKIKVAYLVRNQFSKTHSFLSGLKHSLKKQKTISHLDSLSFREEQVQHPINRELKDKLVDRLKANIENLNNCDIVIGVSKDVKKHLMHYGVAKEKIVVQHIGSTIADTNIHHSKVVQKEQIIFGFIGGVSYYKGVHQLVDAFLSMPDDYKKKAKLKIFGKYNDNYKKSVDVNIIQDRTYKDNIVFYGRYAPKDIKNITNEVDIAILPSLCADTAPQTIFESFSSELPIIAPSIGGFPDFIEHGRNGLIYEAANVESLKESLMYIIDNPELIDSMRLNIPKMKTISDNAKELINLYDKLLSAE